jgi:chromosome partitioning protein
MKVVSCYSIKGGVGKTATSVNMAFMAAHGGYRTLLIDLDPQGASSFYFRVKPSKKQRGKRLINASQSLIKHIKASDYENLDIVPAHLSFRHFDNLLGQIKKSNNRLSKTFEKLSKEYDLIILDCPPTLSYLSEAVFTASDVIFVPVIPTTLSERTYDQLLEFFKKHDFPRKRIVPFFTMVQAQKSMHKTLMKSMSNRYSRFLKTRIPFSADIENMGEYRSPVAVFAKHRPANQAYIALWQEMEKKIKKT